MNDAYNITQFTLLKSVMLKLKYVFMCILYLYIKHYNYITAALLNHFQLNYVKIFSGHDEETHHIQYLI